MLKKTVTFEDFNNEQQTEDLYFNLTRTELLDMLDLLPRLEAWQAIDTAKMTQKDTVEFFAIIRELIAASYGVRSEDGKFFRKSPEAWDEFKSSAAYDAFLYGFIGNADEALEFMIGILPKGIDDNTLAQARVEMAKVRESNAEVVELPQPLIEDAVDMDKRPAWVKEDREPTKKELMSMSKEEMQDALRRRLTAN